MNFFPFGWIQRVESSRRDRSSGKLGYQVNPDVPPGR
jgi:hypothetical protein